MPVKSVRLGLAAFLSLGLLGACNRVPAEPERTASTSTAAPTPAVAPLVWDVPGAWTTIPAPPSGPKKATYKIPKAGNDKEDAELVVMFFGTGSKGDPEKNIKDWFDQFDGNVGATAAREQFDARGGKVETVEVKGTYKVSLGPPVGPQKKAAVAMVKNDFRLYGAVVKTPDRGNWFFRLVGPDETVQSAKSAMRSMLESAR